MTTTKSDTPALLTTAQVAAMHDRSKQSILARASRLGMEPAEVVGNVHRWTREQAQRLKPGRPGRPKKDG